MPIVSPETQTVDLSHGRGSKIDTADTYVRPAIPQPDEGLQQLSKALQSFGGSVGDLAAQKQASKDKQDLLNLDYHVENTKQQAGTTSVTDAQVGAINPDMSPIVRTRVAQQLGAQDGAAWMQQETEKLLQDQKLRDDPDAMKAAMENLRQQAWERAKANPAWGAGLIGTVKSGTQRLEEAAQKERAALYDKLQTDQLQGEAEATATARMNGKQPAFIENSPSANKLANVDPANLQTPLQIGTAILGADENKNNRTIAAFIKAGTGKTIDPSVTPWCAAFVDAVLGLSNLPRANTLRAMDFANYGADASKDPKVGDIVVFKQEGGHGHVGFLAGINSDGTIKVLGGNQGNKVSATDYDKSEVLTYRRSAGVAGAPSNRGGAFYGAGVSGPTVFQAPSEAVQTYRRPEPGQFARDAQRVAHGDGPVDFVNAVFTAESSNDPNAKNPNSSASGLAQFTDGTWLGYAKKQPEAAGMSDADLLKLKGDANWNKKLTLAYAEDNAKALAKANLPATKANLYLAHVLDGPVAAKMLKAKDGTPVENILDEDAVTANGWQGKTVAEVKEQLATKVGAPVDPSLAMANGTRQLDTVWSKSSSLNDVRRREVFADYYAKRAIATGDKRYLEAMPQEWMTPAIQDKFADSARKVDEYKWQQYQHQKTREADQRAEETRLMKDQINQDLAKGKPIDPRQFASNNEAFNYAIQQQNVDFHTSPLDSNANRAKLESDIGSAGLTGDWSKVNPAWTGRTPSNKELIDFVHNNPNMRSDEKIKLINGLDKITGASAVASSPEVKDFYNRHLNKYAEALQGSLATKLSEFQGNGLVMGKANVAGEVSSFFEGEMYSAIKAYTVSNGHPPEGEALRQIMVDVKKQTQEHMTQYMETLNNAILHPDQKTAEVAPAGKTAEATPPAKPTSGITYTDPELAKLADVAPPGFVWVNKDGKKAMVPEAEARQLHAAEQAAKPAEPAATPGDAKAAEPKPDDGVPDLAALLESGNAGVTPKAEIPALNSKSELNVPLPKEIAPADVEKSIKRTFYAQTKANDQTFGEWVGEMIPALKQVINQRYPHEQEMVDTVSVFLKDDPTYQKLRKAADDVGMFESSSKKQEASRNLEEYTISFAKKLIKELNEMK